MRRSRIGRAWMGNLGESQTNIRRRRIGRRMAWIGNLGVPAALDRPAGSIELLNKDNFKLDQKER